MTATGGFLPPSDRPGRPQPRPDSGPVPDSRLPPTAPGHLTAGHPAPGHLSASHLTADHLPPGTAGWSEPYYAPGWQPAQPPHEPLAVWSLVTGLLGLGPVALGLGLGALRRTARHGRRGRGLALAGLTLGGVGTLAAVVLLVVGTLTAAAHRPLPADLTEPQRAHAVQLVTGSCLATLPANGEVDLVDVVPCDEPHAARVVTEYDFAADARWPGQQAADATVARACVLTAAEREAGTRAVAWAPTRQGWARGDRTGLCLAVTPAGPGE